MKAKFIVLAGALALLAACEEKRYELDSLVPDEYSKILYIKEYGTPEITLYNADEQTDYTFSVNIGGKDYMNAAAACDIRTLTQAEVDNMYSIPEGVGYKVLTKGYSFDTPHLEFTEEEFYKDVTLSMMPKVIEEEMGTAPNSTWVLPVYLYSGSDTVNAEKDEIFMKITMKSPSVGFNAAVERPVQYENGVPKANYVEFGIDAENQWGLTCTFTVDEMYAAAMYPGYRVLPEECYEFDRSIQLDKGQKSGDLFITFTGAKLDWGDYVLPIRMDSEPVASSPDKNMHVLVIRHSSDWEITGKYEERRYNSDGKFKYLLDGDPETFWASHWDGPNARDLPPVLVIDTKEEHNFSRVGFMHRNVGYHLDHHNYSLEFYVSSDSRTWWNFDHDKFWEGKESGDVDWTEYGWKTDTNWESQANWTLVGKVAYMKSLHNPEYEYYDLDSSVKGRYFIIKVTYSGIRDEAEFAEIDLQTVVK